MGKLIKTDCRYPLAEVVGNIDSEKFWIPITEEILIKNGWRCSNCYIQWYSNLPQEIREWTEQNGDFEGVTIWYNYIKECWCYRYGVTYVYDIKSIGELEIILAREGFVYEFDV